MRRLPIAALVLLVGACSLGEASPTTTVQTGSGGGTEVATTTTVDAAAEATLAQVLTLVQVAEDLRGLDFLEAPNIVVVTPDELEARVRDLIAEELEPDDLARDQATMELLGILPGGVDLEQLYLDIYGEQVGGYYDPETAEMVVPASAEDLLVKDRVVIVHELVHALTDQHFGHGDQGIALFESDRFDEHTALLAVVEGDAVRIESDYVRTLSVADLEELIRQYGELDTTVFDSAPFFIQESLVWPYLDGFEFMNRLGGSNDDADAAYVGPPISTEQVVDEVAFAEGEQPIEVVIGTPVPEGYEIGEASTWGYAGLESLLGAVVDAGPLRAGVDGWGGDAYRILFDGQNAVFQLHYVGDEPTDLGELADAFGMYLEAVVDPGDTWQLLTDGTELVVLVADDAAAIDAIVAGLDGFGGLELLPEPPLP